MSTYLEFIKANRKSVQFQVVRCIDNKSLHQSLHLRSNVWCDGNSYYISNEQSTIQIKSKELRIRLSALNAKMRLTATQNDFYNTRLIYSVKLKG